MLFVIADVVVLTTFGFVFAVVGKKPPVLVLVLVLVLVKPPVLVLTVVVATG
jgi:hypothetical protein